MLEQTPFGSSLHLWLTYLSITSSNDLFFLGRPRDPSNIFIFLPMYFPRDDTFSFVIYNSSYFNFFQSTTWHLVVRRFTCRPLGVHVHVMYHLGWHPLWWTPISNVCHMDWYRGKHALCFACLICMPHFSHKRWLLCAACKTLRNLFFPLHPCALTSYLSLLCDVQC